MIAVLLDYFHGVAHSICSVKPYNDSRTLSTSEQIKLREHRLQGNNTVPTIVFLRTRHPIATDILRYCCLRVAEKHMLLRSRIVLEGGQPCWQETKHTHVDVQECMDSNWKTLLEEHARLTFDSTSASLWSVTFLPNARENKEHVETRQTKERPHACALIFAFHPAIVEHPSDITQVVVTQFINALNARLIEIQQNQLRTQRNGLIKNLFSFATSTTSQLYSRVKSRFCEEFTCVDFVENMFDSRSTNQQMPEPFDNIVKLSFWQKIITQLINYEVFAAFFSHTGTHFHRSNQTKSLHEKRGRKSPTRSKSRDKIVLEKIQLISLNKILEMGALDTCESHESIVLAGIVHALSSTAHDQNFPESLPCNKFNVGQEIQILQTLTNELLCDGQIANYSFSTSVKLSFEMHTKVKKQLRSFHEWYYNTIKHSNKMLRNAANFYTKTAINEKLKAKSRLKDQTTPSRADLTFCYSEYEEATQGKGRPVHVSAVYSLLPCNQQNQLTCCATVVDNYLCVAVTKSKHYSQTTLKSFTANLKSAFDILL